MPGSGKPLERDFGRTAPDEEPRLWVSRGIGGARCRILGFGGGRAAGACPGELEELDLTGS